MKGKRFVCVCFALFAAASCGANAIGESQTEAAATRIDIELPPALSHLHGAYKADIGAALDSVAIFFQSNGLGSPDPNLIGKVIVFETTAAARSEIAARFGVSLEAVPDTFSGTVADGALFLVSRAAYEETWRAIYPEWPWTDDAYRKLITHELAHIAHEQLSIARYGTAEAMGPPWFFEGFAVFAAEQFDKAEPALTFDELKALVGGGNEPEVSYPVYGRIVRSLAAYYGLNRLVDAASEKGFPDLLLDEAPVKPETF